MKNKYWVLIIAALTVIGTFWTQTELGGKKYRTHQHKEYLSVEDTIPDVQEAINAEQISESQYNSEAVDIEKLKTHLPVVKIETSEEIPGENQITLEKKILQCHIMKKNIHIENIRLRQKEKVNLPQRCRLLTIWIHIIRSMTNPQLVQA